MSTTPPTVGAMPTGKFVQFKSLLKRVLALHFPDLRLDAIPIGLSAHERQDMGLFAEKPEKALHPRLY